MEETQKFYVGPRGVDHVVIDEMKTFGGNEVVVVHYDGGFSQLMTKKTYELICTPEPSDFTMIRNKKLWAITKELYPLLSVYISSLVNPIEEIKVARTEFLQKCVALVTEYDVTAAEIEALLNPINAEIQGAVNMISNELDNVFNRATNYLWTKDDSQFIPGANMMLERTLLEATKVNQTIPAPVLPPAPANDDKQPANQ